jgi:secreted trypsin-like serine protease
MHDVDKQGHYRGPLWAALVGALVAAMGVSFFVFVQRGEAAPQAVADEQHPYASVTPKMIGGTQVPNGKYPFMAHIEIRFLNGWSTCEGTLIDRDSVLTAAHCLENSIGASVVVGRTNLRQRNQGQVREVSRPFIHPRYNRNQRADVYDAGVLKLRRAVTGIKPIKLATAKQNNLETPGRILTVASWGVTRAKGTPVARMRQVRIPVVSDSRAEKGYDAFYVPSLQIAASKQGKTACQGDSGAPLFDSGSRTQVGIVNGGRYKCGTARYPAFFAEVNNPQIRNFILRAAKR